MKNLTILFLCLSFFMVSCEDYNQEILPIVGVYEANVIGVTGPFSLSISSDGGDDIKIEAPFDGDNWEVLSADIDNADEDMKSIELFDTNVADGVVIKGEGYYFDKTIQLDYEVIIDGHSTGYTIVGSKL